MRTIKFRIWNGKDGYCTEDFVKANLFNIIDSHPEYVQQFTGLLDKNGNEIFEGDIVKGFMDKLAVVKFGDYMVNGSGYYSNYATAGFYIDYGNNEDSTYYIQEKEIEIIGNIYENKDLL